jgi:hypothetical protein
VELEGVVRNGVIVPAGQCPLPEGTKVRIQAADSPPARPTLGQRLRELAERAEQVPCDLPSDLSVNHDHYLSGTSKQQP